MKSQNHKKLIWIPIVVLFFATLACVGQQNLGELTISETPTIFTLRGEVDSSWRVSVNPNQVYDIVVRSVETTHPMNGLDIWAEKGSQNLAAPVVYSENMAMARFTAPTDGEVVILIYSKIGERQEELGTFSIQLNKVMS